LEVGLGYQIKPKCIFKGKNKKKKLEKIYIYFKKTENEIMFFKNDTKPLLILNKSSLDQQKLLFP
jgi:hypothetical protein